MKAIVCNRLGDPSVLEVEERPSRSPGNGEARVALKAAALNFPDILMIAGGYQVKPALPFIPGIEAAGEIVETGSDAGPWRVGDRVIVTGAGDPLGLFAEEVTAPISAFNAVPAGMSFAAASGYLATYATSYHALVDRGHLRAGETLVVHGATGGVGTAAVQIGKVLGATVIATGGDDGKLEAVRAMGADHLINYRSEDVRERVKELTHGRGADVIYDPVGGPVFEASMRCIALEGRILIIGATSGTYAPAKTNHILIKEIEVIGVLHGNWRSRHPDRFADNMRILGEWAEAGRIAPHVGRIYPLERAADALKALANREVVGKCVLSME
ncbi:MAG: NADPH:quinone oxidoreductase family protein [Microvirga sp.]